MNWQEAWEIHKDAAAEAAHIRWMQAKQAHGFADHPTFNSEMCNRTHCEKPPAKHHSDMIPFADLSDEIKAYDYESSVVGFKVGWEAGHSSGFEEGWNAHLEPPA